VEMHTYNPSQEAEAGRSEFQVSLEYIVRKLSQKKKKKSKAIKNIKRFYAELCVTLEISNLHSYMHKLAEKYPPSSISLRVISSNSLPLCLMIVHLNYICCLINCVLKIILTITQCRRN
jgi:hypothetical protein